MKRVEPKLYYRRNLPHYQPMGGTFFVTFRLTGSLPREVVSRLKEEKESNEYRIAGVINDKERAEKWHAYQAEYFEKFDALLDGNSTGPLWLKEEKIASQVANSVRFFDGTRYDVLAFCIMPNHVHLVCTLLPGAVTKELLESEGPSAPYILTSILQSVKKYSAREANKILGRSGEFWQPESYDHLVRNSEELERLLAYVLNNPVKARLCDAWDEWQWTYVKPGLL
jgi:putative transposase